MREQRRAHQLSHRDPEILGRDTRIRRGTIRIEGRTRLSQLGFQAKAERLSSDKLLQIWVPRINPSLIVQTELSQRDRLVLGPNSLLVQHVRQAPFPLQRLGFMYR